MTKRKAPAAVKPDSKKTIGEILEESLKAEDLAAMIGKEFERLHVENERLRDVLKRIVRSPTPDTKGEYETMRIMALTALKD